MIQKPTPLPLHLSSLETCYTQLSLQKDVQINSLLTFISDINKVTAKMGSTFQKASTDLEKKISMIKDNDKIFPTIKNLFSFMKAEIECNIHKLSGKNGSKVPAQLVNYISTSRTTMRLLWFLQFIEAMLEGALNKKYKSHLELVQKSYASTLGQHHGWLTRNIAKISIGSATDNPYFLVQALTGGFDNKQFINVVQTMLQYLKPLISQIKSFYKNNGITNID